MTWKISPREGERERGPGQKFLFSIYNMVPVSKMTFQLQTVYPPHLSSQSPVISSRPPVNLQSISRFLDIFKAGETSQSPTLKILIIQANLQAFSSSTQSWVSDKNASSPSPVNLQPHSDKSPIQRAVSNNYPIVLLFESIMIPWRRQV